MHRLLLLLSLITGSSSLINCRTACTECRFRRLTPEALQVHCTMCKECKQKLRERMSQLRRQQSQSPQSQTPQYQSPQYQTPQSQTPQYQTPKYQTPQPQTPQYQSPQYQTPQYQYPQAQYQCPTPPICQDQCPTPPLCAATERTTNDAYDIYPAGCPTPPPCPVCPPGCVSIAPPPVRRMDDYEEMPLFDLGNIVVGLPNHIAVDNNQLK